MNTVLVWTPSYCLAFQTVHVKNNQKNQVEDCLHNRLIDYCICNHARCLN